MLKNYVNANLRKKLVVLWTCFLVDFKKNRIFV